MSDLLDPTIRAHYELGVEQPRLARDSTLEWVHAGAAGTVSAAPPAAVLDVGGGPGVYAGWLAEHAHDVWAVGKRSTPGKAANSGSVDSC